MDIEKMFLKVALSYVNNHVNCRLVFSFSYYKLSGYEHVCTGFTTCLQVSYRIQLLEVGSLKGVFS